MLSHVPSFCLAAEQQEAGGVTRVPRAQLLLTSHGRVSSLGAPLGCHVDGDWQPSQSCLCPALSSLQISRTH